MVSEENLVYLFMGQDIIDPEGLSKKDEALQRIKNEHLAKGTSSFNLDILYAKELTLRDLQERLLCLPVKSKKRIIVIKDAQVLKDKEDIREFIIRYVKKPHPWILLVLDMIRRDSQDRDEFRFINSIARCTRVYHFKETARLDTFTLSKQIDLNRIDYALCVLNQLLQNGERPERILGGLRYVWENNLTGSLEARKRFRLLLNCDIEIKTGRLPPPFALERLVVRLCSLKKP